MGNCFSNDGPVGIGGGGARAVSSHDVTSLSVREVRASHVREVQESQLAPRRHMPPKHPYPPAPLPAPAMAIERVNIIPARDRIMMTDQPLAIWEKEHDKVFLSLLVEQISNGGRNNILPPGMDSWSNIVAEFNNLTRLRYEYRHLHERFIYYERQYQIVNRIRRHPKFEWDQQRQVVIAADAEWNKYIEQNPDAKGYRTKNIPYIDLLEILFANTEA